MVSPEDTKGKRVVVKFARRYSEEAHKVLTEKPLAPKFLYYKAHKVHFVVMERIDARPMETGYAPESKGKSIGLLRKALTTYCMTAVSSLVREPDILIAEDNDLKLVDFEWAGKVGEVLYPGMINMEIPWPEGVEGWKKMRLSTTNGGSRRSLGLS